ncbi:MAG: hypothetical protein R3B47_14475 [Bacteroidia bacterium]
MVLDTAKMMEHQAKEDGRNRLGIKVLKHSGEAEMAVLTWEELPKLKLVVNHLHNYVSDKFVGDLGREIMQLSGVAYHLEKGHRKIDTGILKAEINRLIKKRKTGIEYGPELLASLSQTVEELFMSRRHSPRTLIDILSIAMFIERVTFISNLPKTKLYDNPN